MVSVRVIGAVSKYCYGEDTANNKNEHMLVDFRVPSVATSGTSHHHVCNVKDTGIAIATPTRTQPSESAALGEARGQTYG